MPRRARSAAFVLLISTLCVASPPPSGCPTAADPKSDQDQVFLQDSGSTNTADFCLAVTRSGKVLKNAGASHRSQPQASAASTPAPQSSTISASLAQKLFADVEAAMPLSSLPRTFCPKSASFGTTQVIWFRGEKTPDLCRRTNEQLAPLREDFVNVINAAEKHSTEP